MKERLTRGNEVVDRQHSDVLAVERSELLEIEEGRRMVDVFHPELALDDGPRNDLLVTRRRPSEGHQVVDHRLGEVSLGAVLLDGHLVASLRQLLALLVDE